jgi:hypothetical protein
MLNIIEFGSLPSKDLNYNVLCVSYFQQGNWPCIDLLLLAAGVGGLWFKESYEAGGGHWLSIVREDAAFKQDVVDHGNGGRRFEDGSKKCY